MAGFSRRAAVVVVSMVAVAAAAAGCAHGGQASKGATVSDLDLARVSPGDLQQVNQARMNVAGANDEVARSGLAARETQQALQVAQADVNVAKAEVERANKALANATETGQQEGIADAQREKQQGQNNLELANAHVAALNARYAQDQAHQQVAQRRLDLQNAELERAKYQALVDVKDPAAQKYSPETFQKNVAQAGQKLNDAQATFQRRALQADSANQRYREQQQRLQAQGGAGAPRG